MPYSHIIDNIYVGDIFSTNNKELLSQLKCIISLVENVIHHNNIEYLTLLIEDKCDENILPLCEKAYDYILKQPFNHKILIHCMAGGSRSVSIILYYIMKKYKTTFNEAYNFMNIKYNNMNVNKGFISQLKSLDL